MANTFELIESYTATGTVGSITFMSVGNIPSTYTDLCVKVSGRTTRASAEDFCKISFNGVSTNQSMKALRGTGSAASSYSDTLIYSPMNASTSTTSSFGSTEFYIPNYAGGNYKSVSMDGAEESNTSFATMEQGTGLWSSTAAITSITLTPYYGSFVQYTTAYLYGVKNA